MSIVAKKTKTPRKMQKNNNLLKTKKMLITKCQLGGQILHSACHGSGSLLCPRKLRHCLPGSAFALLRGPQVYVCDRV